MGRPKGSKNKAKVVAAPVMGAGNPDFNLKDAKPVEEPWFDTPAAAAVTDEDMAFDRELERLARNTEPEVSDIDDQPVVRKTIDPYTMLSDFIENYQPAKTPQELEDQIMLAKHHECDSVEATPQLIKYYTKKVPEVGYFLFRDIKVYIPGFFEQSSKRDKETVEYRNFGKNFGAPL